MCEPEGDILMFLTGEQEIEDAVKKIVDEVVPFLKIDDLCKSVCLEYIACFDPCKCID